MLELFPDQIEVMDDLRPAMKRSKAVLLNSPTGSGKTALATYMTQAALGKGGKTSFIVPRKSLLEQTSKTFSSHGINHSFIASGRDFNPFVGVHIGMIETMANRLDKLPKVNLALIDEVHFGQSALSAVIDHYKKQRTWVVGLSATPWKMSGQGLGIWFDEMVQGKSIRWLIDNKRLSNYRYFYGKTRDDFAAIRNSSESDTNSFMEQNRVIIGDCVADYRKRCMGRIHLVRCTSIKHSQITAEAFRNEGIPAMHIDGTTQNQEAIFRAFARREILVLTFADLLNFGFDLSQASGMDVCIESCSDLKPSRSLAGQMQFWGRVLRIKPDAAIINDHVNNYIEHGFPCSDRVWTLDSRKKRKGEKAPPSKQCPNCFCAHPPAPKCPDCGHVYVVNSSEGLKSVDGELVEADINAMRKEPVQEKLFSDEQTLDMLIKWASKNGYKNPAAWAAKELAKKINKRIV